MLKAHHNRVGVRKFPGALIILKQLKSVRLTSKSILIIHYDKCNKKRCTYLDLTQKDEM